MQNALNCLFKLKQYKRSYVEYFEKTKEIERNLFEKIIVIISIRLIQKLNIKTLRMLVEEIISQNIVVNNTIQLTSSLEATIRIIKNALRNINKENNTNSK